MHDLLKCVFVFRVARQWYTEVRPLTEPHHGSWMRPSL